MHPVKVTALYSYNEQSRTYKVIPDITTGLVDSALTTDAVSGECTCTGSLKEVAYTVYVTAKEPDAISKVSYYSIEEVRAEVVIYETPVKSACGQITHV